MLHRLLDRCLAVLLLLAFGVLQGHGVLHALEHEEHAAQHAGSAAPDIVEVDCSLCAAMLPGIKIASAVLAPPVVCLLGEMPDEHIAPYGYQEVPSDRGRAPPVGLV
jgi:hypothetical protein